MNVKWHLSYAWRRQYAPSEAAHAVHHPAAQRQALRVAGAGLRLVHLQPAGHRAEMCDVLVESVVERMEAGEVSHLSSPAESGGIRRRELRCGRLHRVRPGQCGDREGRLQLGGKLHRLRVCGSREGREADQDAFYWPAALPAFVTWPPAPTLPPIMRAAVAPALMLRGCFPWASRSSGGAVSRKERRRQQHDLRGWSRCHFHGA